VRLRCAELRLEWCRLFVPCCLSP